VGFSTQKGEAPARYRSLSGNGAAVRNDLLIALSLGAEFMGSGTDTFNGPYFTAKPIARCQGTPNLRFLDGETQ
jgi:hypothetical protein